LLLASVFSLISSSATSSAMATAAIPTKEVVLAMSLGNPPAVRAWTGKTVLFSSRTVQKPDPQRLRGSNLDP
jgi:hypothetical protein